MNTPTHYPDFNVLDHVGEWDSLTQKIVSRRLGPFPEPEFLTTHEAEMIGVIAKHLLYDDRETILSWVVYHMDQELVRPIGESHRKPTTPSMELLVRQGLQAIESSAQTSYGKGFLALDVQQQFDILASLQLEKLDSSSQWQMIPQKDLFNKLLEISVTAYYSHPHIWSEIGFGGPAYPRGYYRIELGWKDPWEAKHKGMDEESKERIDRHGR